MAQRVRVVRDEARGAAMTDSGAGAAVSRRLLRVGFALGHFVSLPLGRGILSCFFRGNFFVLIGSGNFSARCHFAGNVARFAVRNF